MMILMETLIRLLLSIAAVFAVMLLLKACLPGKQREGTFDMGSQAR
jgi:hypothetical protein